MRAALDFARLAGAYSDCGSAVLSGCYSSWPPPLMSSNWIIPDLIIWSFDVDFSDKSGPDRRRIDLRCGSVAWMIALWARCEKLAECEDCSAPAVLQGTGWHRACASRLRLLRI